MCKKILTDLFMGGMLAGIVAPALAVDTGSITFTGKIVPDSCVVDVNGAGGEGTVTFNQ